MRSCGGGHKNHANWEFMHTSYPCDHMLVGGFFYAGFEKPLEGSITTGHARKLLPMTFLNCHAFGEVVFGGKSPEEIFMLREHAHHTGKEDNCSSKDF